MKIKSFKMKVNAEQSEIVQRILFKNGYMWKTLDQDISCLNSNTLYLDKELSHTSDDKDYSYFNKRNLPELTFEEFKKLYIKEPMETKTLSIQIPEGFEIDKENSTFEKIVFKELPKKPIRITKWKDFGTIEGYYVTTFSDIQHQNEYHEDERDKNVYPTKELAEASLALCQLIRYRDNWNEGWVANYYNSKQNKYIFKNANGIFETDYCWKNTHIFAFKDEETRDTFLKTFKDLLEIAKPLL